MALLCRIVVGHVCTGCPCTRKAALTRCSARVQAVEEKYELVAPLGTGGFAKVFKGKCKADNEDVAVKHIAILECATPLWPPLSRVRRAQCAIPRLGSTCARMLHERTK